MNKSTQMSESCRVAQRLAALGHSIFNENMLTNSMVFQEMDGEGVHTGVDALGQPPTGVARQTKQEPGFQTMMRVVGYRDESAKDLMGVGTEFQVDTTTNPMMTNLMDQDGAYVSLNDIKDFFHVEPMGMDPSNDSSMRGTDMMHVRGGM